VPDERESLGRRQGLENDQERQADRVGEHGLVLGVEFSLTRDQRLRPLLEGILAPRTPGTEHVERDPSDHRRMPAAQVLDPFVVSNSPARYSSRSMSHLFVAVRHGG
jgi:hypothetical protein